MIFTRILLYFPEGAVRAELHISGAKDTCDCLHDLIEEIAEPFDSWEEAAIIVLKQTKLSNFFPVEPLYRILNRKKIDTLRAG